MRGVILVTDHDWFQFLSRQPDLDEVNFWRPSDTRTPQQLKPGMPAIFKLRKQHGGWIVGWGLFAKHDVLPAWLAWDAFELKNGAASFADMRARIESLRRDRGGSTANAGDYDIGCLMLAQPVFLPRDSWIRPPEGWPENAVQGKSYDLESGEGARVWAECLAAGARHGHIADRERQQQTPADRYGEPVLIRPRLGQGIFRLSVTGAYERACAVTGEHSLPALEAAHIRPYGDGGAHEVANGLLLRSDIHRLFDKGYVGVTPDYRFVVSDRLRSDYSNGRSYYPLHDQEIRLPAALHEQPNAEWLEWHLAERFRG
ncbi:MAG: HNH endonuclease [Candidatus Eisenbacteria bacterium]|uniref:HNH endonuclease n=1 Tax=Eiseniibacteriota bacterium TaxID=2212470 RepID=A0A849SEB3_UNCEI|nr:HNH endonuclease [Candidatus Eisenbacteria bacterium]